LGKFWGSWHRYNTYKKEYDPNFRSGFFRAVLLLLLWLIIYTILTSGISGAAAQDMDSMKLSGDNLTFDRETGLVTLETDIRGEYGPFYFMADKIEVKMEEEDDQILSYPEEINMAPGDFTGCDLDEPHYIFKASSITIYPDDYLVAYHVVFYELDGRLPLFYWPVIYINLDDERPSVEFEYGYSSRRGWFGKLTFNHRWLGPPGQLYLDYYQHTGWAGGFRQYYLETPTHMGYIEYYNQENRIDLPGLFNWEALLSHELDWGNWSGDTYLNYQDYDHHYYASGEGELEYEGEDYTAYFDGDHEREIYDREEDADDSVVETTLAAGYDRSFSFDFWQFRDLDIFLDYEIDMVDYLETEEWDQEISDLALGFDKSFAGNFNLGMDYRRQADIEPDEDPRVEETYAASSDYSWGEGWFAEAEYEYGELEEPGAERVERWDALARAGRDIGDWRYDLTLERDEPDFPDPEDEEEVDAVSFLRWPEANVYYEPRGPLDYQMQLGRYYEEDTDLEGYRAAGTVNYSDRWQILDWLELQSEQSLAGSMYRTEEGAPSTYIPHHTTFDSELTVENEFTDHLTLSSSHNYEDYLGSSPFRFDRRTPENSVDSELSYNRDSLKFAVDSGYDLLAEEYMPLAAAVTFWPVEEWELSLETEYDLNERLFSDELIFTSALERERMTSITSLEYDLNQNRLETISSELDLEVPGDYGWFLTGALEYEFYRPEGDRLQEASITFRQRLHCRELRFSYDHIDEEFMVSYHLDLFAGRGVGLGRSEEESVIFDAGAD